MASYMTGGYQYETSPRKLRPEYEPNRNPHKKKTTAGKKPNSKSRGKVNKNTKDKTAKKTKNKAKYNYKPVIYIILGFLMLFTISYRNSLINENYNKKEAIKSQVSALQKENEQLKVSIENSLNLNSVEKSAEEKLGMQKLNNNQKVYFDLQKKDYVEPASEEVIIKDNLSWFDKLLEKLTQIIK